MRRKYSLGVSILAILGGWSLAPEVTSAQSLASGASALHTLGIRPDGTVAAWGWDVGGQVSQVPTINNATAVSAGHLHSLALRADGTIAAWGLDGNGRLSGATSVNNAVAVSAGGFHSMALLSDGTVYSFGVFADSPSLSVSNSVSNAVAISAAWNHSLALRSDGTVAAWGSDSYGNVSGANSVVGATAIATGSYHSLALLGNGTVSAWGRSSVGQTNAPNTLVDAVAVAAAGESSFALRSNGQVVGWGYDWDGNVSGTHGATDVVFVSAGPGHTYLIHSNGTLSSYGRNTHGQRNTPSGFQLPTTVRWTSATNGDYLNSHLWNGRIPSTALSTAVFDKSGTYSINFGNTAQAKGLEVAAGDLTFNLGNHQYLVGTNVNIANGATFTTNGTLTASGLITNNGTYNSNGHTSAHTISNFATWNVSGLVSAFDALVNRGVVEINNGSEVLVGSGTPMGDGNAQLRVGKVGGATLVIMDGGRIHNTGYAKIGTTAGEFGTLRVAGVGGELVNAYSMDIGTAGFGEMYVVGGGRVVSGSNGSPSSIGNVVNRSRGEVTVNGSGSIWELSSDLAIDGQQSLLTIGGGGIVTNNNGMIGDAIVTVNGQGSSWNNSGALRLRYPGQLSIEAAGVVASASIENAGRIVVTGNGSRLDVDGALEFVSGSGQMGITTGGVVTSQNARVGTQVDVGYGDVSISGSGSEWINAENLAIGGSGAAYGKMTLADGGRMNTLDATVHQGDVAVGGNDATWMISNDLQLGTNRYSTLSINDGGNVFVGNRTTITPNGQVYMNGGRFEFGKMSLASYKQVGRYGGAMAGQVEVTGVHNFATLEPLFSNSQTAIYEVQLSNFGTLVGSGLVDVGLDNKATGHVRTMGNDWMRFGGTESSNDGRITNLGGTIEFGGRLTNQTTGFVTGRGAFVADRFDNRGSMAVSGASDFIGKVNNFNGALIVTSANSTTTFYDAVVNNGEIRTSGNGKTVFFEDVSGAGSYTGTGTVFFEGNVNPGNSPAAVNFEGSLVLGSGSDTLIELGGLNSGQFDQFNIAGDFDISGSLSVALWNNFELGSNMSFLIADIGGIRLGMFQGLGEGDLVGQVSGHDLFITYTAGSGNDVALFTAVPEPSAFLLCLLPMLGLAAVRRRP